MVSAGCVHKNTTGCDKRSQTLYLKDRYDVTFPVKNCCSECYNIIYNTKPLFLFQHEKELEKLNLSAYRIHFTFETQTEAEQILTAYQTAFVQHAFVKPEDYVADFTNGHYKRGVE
jgi:putative protease